MNSTIPPVSRRAARVLLAVCLLAMAWYGYYQIETYLRLVVVEISRILG